MLWIFVVGAIASAGLPAWPWFTAEVGALVMSLAIRSPRHLAAFLTRYLWLDSVQSAQLAALAATLSASGCFRDASSLTERWESDLNLQVLKG